MKHRTTQPKQIASHTVSQTIATQWSGPLPSPSDMEHFGNIIPGGAERIFRMAEIEQEHRLLMDRATLEANIAIENTKLQTNIQSINNGHRDARIGQVLGFAVSISAICGAAWTAWIGAHWSVSVAMVSVPITSIVKAFLSKSA